MMNKTSKKKILIVGSSAKEYSLAKKMLSLDNVEEVFVAPGNSAMAEFCSCVDIREDNVHDLLKFVLEKNINLTIATSQKAIKADISSFFQANSQLIFAPTAQSANCALSKSFGKKFLYKLHIPTPKFGVFEKEQPAQDYIKISNMPVVIRMDEELEGRDRIVASSLNIAKIFISDLFVKGEQKVLIEDYVYGHEFTFYVMTDGYTVLPLCAVANYKFMEEGEGGLLTSGVGAFAPDYKISSDIEAYIMQNVVLNVISSLQVKETPYLGILGIDCVLKNDGSISVLEFRPFLSDHDCQAVLNLVDDNLYNLFEACAVGSFGDDYEGINLFDAASVSCVLYSRQAGKVISGIETLDNPGDISHFATRKNHYMEYETPSGKALVVTKTSRTLSRARLNLYEDIDLINFEGKKFRSDICPIVK